MYDHKGVLQAGRVYWMLKAFGHKNVSILSGGYKKWVAEGREVETTSQSDADYEYTFNPALYRTIEQVHQVVKDVKEKKSEDTQIFDARMENQFNEGHVTGA